MPSRGPPSPEAQQQGIKRQRHSDSDRGSPRNGLASPTADAPPKPGQGSNFRNVSACNRCRLRKNRCDQQLPSCASCAKAGVACVGYDPITKKEIPRSYVFYLETRVEQLERLLLSNNISFPPAKNLEPCSRPSPSRPGDGADRDAARPRNRASESLKAKKTAQSSAMLSIASPSRPRSLASASGVSFARVVYAAVQYSVSDQAGTGERSGHRNPGGSGTSMRDSFFGLHTKPTIQPAPFPDKDVGLRLVTLYFEHANPQIPILHRGQFMHVFEHAYDNPGKDLAARELYLLNMVFAIGCGVIVGEPVKTEASEKMPMHQTRKQRRPEEYHASAIVHLESCLSFSGGGLEVLQAVLLLANFALLRPVPPGLWYITGVAVRLAVDLGLHHEDGGDVEGPAQVRSSGPDVARGGAQERGRRLWTRDMRRRLWWCTYSFDRLVSTCVGRPFGVSDQVITTELPSLLEDDFITPTGFLEEPEGNGLRPSYKHVAHHYFRLRMLQSEMLQVLQYNQAQMARAAASSSSSSSDDRQGARYRPEMHARLSSPYLACFDSFRTWRIDIDRRLYEWKAAAPTRLETGVAFSTEFLELNYWQAIIMLYRQSLSVPVMFEGEYNTSDEVNSPAAYTVELREDEDRIYLKVAEAGQKILRIYRQLHLSGLVSYTYLSTHHLLMAGISYLYAIWHSPVVRSRLSMDEVDFTVLAAKSVFTDMIDKCPPAETCRDAFDRTAKATIKMASSSGGFGPRPGSHHAHRHMSWAPGPGVASSTALQQQQLTRHGHSKSADQGSAFHLDMPMPDKLSSPSQSAATGEGQTPPLRRAKTFDADTHMAPACPHGAPRPAENAMSHEGARPPSSSPIDPLLAPSPPLSMSRRADLEQPASTFMGQQQQQQQQPFGVAQGSAGDYPDSQTLEFLQTLGGDGMHGLDQAQLDLGFGINWEGTYNDYGEGQQMNPFDTFFFGGGQQSGGGNGGSVGRGRASSHGSSGGGISM
ncbi:fungal specific transcription factor [Hirsutella rhossiliensis]|uniref:Fungal specific transcription factor domain-containing protein n=1 Tax=Hirsutella rhossiliensis TaxID=111463 RepID=A0A9P8N2H9_9HYPO|nr:fungal specific transcription factor domain-containing protein [Hirsutella rhossiliensis]KAH0965685.1 fungal specific transcription factor domain-containing protein [Hirsutella rhossiliensis]